MSNTETQPVEQVCVKGRSTPGDVTEPSAPVNGQLSPGIVSTPTGTQLLEPREVPLGGPRAMRVQRTLPQRARSLIGAWCFVDSYGPADLTTSTPMRVPRHPHTGLATCSWLFSGEIDHIDSAGHWATVRPGDVVLMNAGRGITHSEHSAKESTTLHGVQLWYAFPDAYRFSAPSLETHRPETVRGEGWQMTVFVGELLGRRSLVRPFIPLTAAEIRLEPGAGLDIEVPTGHEHGLLQVSGAVTFNGSAVPADHLGVAETGTSMLRIEAHDEPVLALLIGGEPLNEQIVMWWNFVGRSHEEIAAYRAQYQAEMGFEPEASQKTGYDAADSPRFGEFPPGQPAPLPAPTLPNTRMKPRG